MSNNANLTTAKNSKNDEFYTSLSDIENEVKYYREHFEGKHVFLNCDDPKYSNFWEYFTLNFDFLKLKHLTATHYSKDNSTYRLDYYIDDNGQVTFTQDELAGDGDFRSEESIAILKECDIVVTNPPFSLFREYMAQLMGYNKKFLIIGNQNNITYKEIFPLLKDNKVWLGMNNGVMEFKVPNKEEYIRNNGFRVDENGVAWRKFGNICWFTNLDYEQRYEEQILWKTYNPEEYPTYDNYDAINVNKVKDIPSDFDGVMGVPITFLNTYNPNQFDILGLTTGRHEFEAQPTKRYVGAIQVNRDGTTTNGSKANTRATILHKETPDGVYYTADNADGYLKIVYARILIKNKRPVESGD